MRAHQEQRRRNGESEERMRGNSICSALFRIVRRSCGTARGGRSRSAWCCGSRARRRARGALGKFNRIKRDLLLLLAFLVAVAACLPADRFCFSGVPCFTACTV